MARIEFEAGNLASALEYIQRFLKQRLEHPGGRILQARILLASGQNDAALAEARAIQSFKPDHLQVVVLLKEIAAAQTTQKALKHIALIDAGFPEIRGKPIAEDVLNAAKALSECEVGPEWANDAVNAKIAYFHHATDLNQALRNYDPHLTDVSAELDYITWPKRIHEFVKGKSVLDVGCGFGGYGMGFLIAGATSYTGLDPAMDLDSTRAKNKRIREWSDMGVTPREIMLALPDIDLYQGTAESITFNKTFDTIALHNVTEHLLQLDLVFEGLLPLCAPDTRIVFLHHNYYCWNGHHFQPNQPHQFDPYNPDHLGVYDWNHIGIVDQLPEDHYFRTGLNRVTLDEIHAITHKHFEVEEWREIPSSPATLARLTPDVRTRVQACRPELNDRDLSVNVVYCVARRKT